MNVYKLANPDQKHTLVQFTQQNSDTPGFSTTTHQCRQPTHEARPAMLTKAMVVVLVVMLLVLVLVDVEVHVKIFVVVVEEL